MKITIQEVKNAMKDMKFRLMLPYEFREDVLKYENNPGCPCNLAIYKKILTNARKQLQEYYPGKEIEEVKEESEDIKKMMQNNFSVINCHVSELESKLRSLPPGRKQIAVTRYQDNITVIVNELDVVF